MSTVRVTLAAGLVTMLDPADVTLTPGRDDPTVTALVTAACAGDCDAFGELVSLHEHVVLRTALAALGRREDAEEAAQDAFLIAWKKLPGFRRESTFRTWLLTIVWRKALDRRRARSLWWRRAQSASDDNGSLFDQMAAEAPDPERTATARDASVQIRRAIGQLSPKLRDALLLSAAGECTYTEIAAVLGIPVGTLKWRVAEARRILNARVGA